MEVLIPADRIHQRVEQLAREIAENYQGQPVTIVGVLTGCVVFVADFIRRLDLSLKIVFVQASSYRESTRPGELLLDLEALPDVRGRHILLIDDILDTGRTITKIVSHIKAQQPASLKVVVLLRKIGRQEIPFEPDYIGFTIPDAFVVGYGLDYNGEYRHLPYIGVLSAEEES